MKFWNIHRFATNQRGLSLLETALVLAVLGLVVAGVWALSAGAFGSSKKNRLAEQVITTVEGVRSYMRNTSLGTTTLNTQQLWNLGVLPADLRRGAAFRNAYSGNFLISLSSTTFIIVLTNIPSDACVDLLYSRLGGSNNTYEDFGLIGYAPSDTTSATFVNDFSFNAVTSSCNGSTNLALSFRSQ